MGSLRISENFNSTIGINFKQFPVMVRWTAVLQTVFNFSFLLILLELEILIHD